ncbi:MAG: type II toxin-antitoxin system RelE/ParE family toxin [Beijerinckiaceae bacterium]|nr:type II toxin-antitoxin system RelE/ParE family toxin [Beijerinckiaceae bacterium]MCZ8301611.1 type II toxin-antitoxin system RelE/ParE family toxin [Beijerinckiaceae bacterium]
MIISFADRRTERFFHAGICDPRWQAFATIARRKLDYLDAAKSIMDLLHPPGNRLERLRGNRAGQWSIRINDQWRLCFTLTEKGASHVEIVDYH